MTDTTGATHAASPLETLDPALRERLRNDHHRPRYHFLPPANWLNDPNGLIQWQGRYHLFYQYNPNGAFHGTIHWGHAVSDDLVHWEHLPVALAPTPGSPDAGGCYSGCAVDHDGVPTLVYTGVDGADRQRQLVCLATSRDGLLTWEKHPRNPVIPERPADLDLVQYRDPSVWRGEDGDWYMVHGAGIVGVGGAALLYRSNNLTDWEYLGPIHVGDVNRREPHWTGVMWECPQLCPLGDRHLLAISVWEPGRLYYAAYMVGDFDGRRFTPRTEGVLDWGKYYAPQSMRDDRGRRLIWGWLREGRTKEAQLAAGWSGVMSLPRVLSLGPDGDLRQVPAPELEALRGRHTHLADVAITPNGRGVLGDLRGGALELAVALTPGGADRCGLVVGRSPGGEEETRIVYERATGRLRIDTSRSSLDPATDRAAPAGPCPLDGGRLRLRVFLDGSTLEVFANERVCISERLYPTRPDSLGLDLFAEGGAARLDALDAWEMAAIDEG